MKLPQSRAGRVVGAVATAVVLSGAGTGVALAAAGTPTPTLSGTAGGTAAQGRTATRPHWRSGHLSLAVRWMHRATHGELVFNTKKGPQTVDFQRGVVSAVTSSSVTITSPGGYRRTYTLGSASRIAAPHPAGTKATVSDIASQDRAVVLATPTAGGDTVRFLAAHPVRTGAAHGAARQGSLTAGSGATPGA